MYVQWQYANVPSSGLGCTAEATVIGRQLELARARADVPIIASCACRLDVQPTNCCGD